ncbi:hypothetical protein ABZX75_26525 [Streptomyces sp. NPDC003038]|uniref:hypothetical protein n=1 Tax=unclassified Streptomyces TaxID=2593676 RepID=UPI0033A128A0
MKIKAFSRSTSLGAGLVLSFGLLSAAPVGAQAAPVAAAGPTCSAYQDATSADGKTLSAKWRLCIQKNGVIVEGKCTNKSAFGYWQSTSCDLEGLYTLAKNGKVLPKYRGSCIEKIGDFEEVVPCDDGEERGALFSASGSDGTIDRSMWFECRGAGTYKVTIKAGAFERKNMPQKAYMQRGTSVSAKLC